MVRVLTPQEAISVMTTSLDEMISSATDTAEINSLKNVRKALIGSRPTAENGAINMIEAGNFSAARAFLHIAIEKLGSVEGHDPEVAELLAIIDSLLDALP
jgi:hypothetical protein